MSYASVEMNIEKARFNMVEQQVRPAGVLNPDVVELFSIVKRERFVPAAYKGLAFADTTIPLGYGASMFLPSVEGQMLQAVGVRRHERILEIGTGSGFMAALLSIHAEHVWSMEIVPELAAQARVNLQRAGIANVTVEIGNGLAGLAQQAPFDVIMISGAITSVPSVLLEQLKVDGRLFAITGDAPAMQGQLVTCVAGKGGMGKTTRQVALFETVSDELVPLDADPRFVF
jgi:protein-L-isoaspartate(D-aspartate) O-methyltransferase